MEFTESEAAQFAIAFVKEHADQIKAKAASYRESEADVRQDVIVIFLELAEKYDPAKGSWEQFIFGHLDKRSRRKFCAHRFAISLHQPGNDAEQIRAFVEALPAEFEENPKENVVDLSTREVEMIYFILDRISGKSITEIAQLMGVTTRRVRQIFQGLRQTRPEPKKFIKRITTLHARLSRPSHSS
jgi:DNA-directed RNA polymerase specialized sigma24 family protein